MSSNEMNQSKFPPRGFATRFKNQFDVPIYFHAFANKEKAQEDAGRSGEVIPFISLQEHNYLISQLEGKLRTVKEAAEWMECTYSEAKVNGKTIGRRHADRCQKCEILAAIKEKKE